MLFKIDRVPRMGNAPARFEILLNGEYQFSNNTLTEAKQSTQTIGKMLLQKHVQNLRH